MLYMYVLVGSFLERSYPLNHMKYQYQIVKSCFPFHIPSSFSRIIINSIPKRYKNSFYSLVGELQYIRVILLRRLIYLQAWSSVNVIDKLHFQNSRINQIKLDFHFTISYSKCCLSTKFKCNYYQRLFFTMLHLALWLLLTTVSQFK